MTAKMPYVGVHWPYRHGEDEVASSLRRGRSFSKRGDAKRWLDHFFDALSTDTPAERVEGKTPLRLYHGSRIRGLHSLHPSRNGYRFESCRARRKKKDAARLTTNGIPSHSQLQKQLTSVALTRSAGALLIA